MSAVTVQELLTLPVLRGSELLAGAAGIGREVSGINVMEVPDIESFVVPGEVLLTTAYPLRDHPEALADLVRTLDRRGLAALAVKPGRYLDALPREMLDTADELGFPLIALGPDTSFNEVIGAVLAVVLSDYGADPAGAETIRERLTGVALSGGGLDEIARTLAGALDRPVGIVDQAGSALVAPAEPIGERWSFPVSVAGSERARILVGGDDEPTLGQRRLIRQACFAAGMHIAQALAGLELDRQMRVLNLEELVSGRTADIGVLLQRARLFGWDLTGPRVVVAARGVGALPEGLAVVVTERLLPGAIAWTRGDELVAIWRGADPRLESAVRAWHAALALEAGGGVRVAVGTTVHDPADLAASHAAARDALTIAERTGRTVAVHDHLGVDRVILSVPAERLADLVAAELGPLLEADRATGSDLCATLDAYLGTGNAAEAARSLFIHYNTMKHRMGRIAELLGPRFDAPDARLALAFALRARNFVPPAEARPGA